MGRIVLDTNMMYNILGLRESTYDQHDFVRILGTSECFISSISVIEGLLYYKDDLCNLQIIANSVGKFYGWINIGFLPLRDEDGTFIKSARSLDDIVPILDYYKENKIRQESEFTRLILTQIILCVFYDSLCRHFSENTEKAANFLSYLVAYVSGNKEHYLNRYVALYTDGYSNQSPQKIVKDEFCFDLFTANLFCRVFSIASQKDIDIFSWDKAKFSKEIDMVFRDVSQNSNLTQVNIKKKQEIKGMLEQNRNSLSFDSRFKNNNVALDYIFELVDRILFRNAKFKSNDIADLLVLFALGDDMPNDKVFTHDGRLRSFLERYNRSYSG